ncbi:MAG: DM13 domain-containing protein [Chloroflexota bacterium]
MQKVLTPRFLIAGIVVAVVGLALLWYLVSPLFINNTVSESLPTKIVPAEATAAMQKAMAEPPKQIAEPMPVADATKMKVLAAGSFYNIVHDGKGTATVYQLADGSRVLRLDDFQVLNGPDLHVWLVPVDPVPNSIGTEIAGYVDLGKLKGNIGSQNYPLPATVDVSQFKSVVIWCQPFRVPFIGAALKAS